MNVNGPSTSPGCGRAANPASRPAAFPRVSVAPAPGSRSLAEGDPTSHPCLRGPTIIEALPK